MFSSKLYFQHCRSIIISNSCLTLSQSMRNKQSLQLLSKSIIIFLKILSLTIFTSPYFCTVNYSHHYFLQNPISLTIFTSPYFCTVNYSHYYFLQNPISLTIFTSRYFCTINQPFDERDVLPRIKTMTNSVNLYILRVRFIEDILFKIKAWNSWTV